MTKHRVARHSARYVACVAAIVLPVCIASSSRPARAENVVRGCRYVWSAVPDHPATRDHGDVEQLTDGVYNANPYPAASTANLIWGTGRGTSVTLRFDLGRACRLQRARISSFAFATGGVLPPSLLLASSQNGRDFFWTGALEFEADAWRGRSDAQKLVLEMPLLEHVARYVLVVAMLCDQFAAMDEVELEGEAVAEIGPRFVQIPGDELISTVMRPRLEEFRLEEADAAARLQRRLWSLRRVLHDPPLWDAPVHYFPRTDVYVEEGARLRRRAERWRHKRDVAWSVERSDPWRSLTPWSEPHAVAPETLHVLRGAWSAASFDLWCTAPSGCEVALAVEPAARGAPRLELRQVLCVEARDGVWSGDALLPAAARYAVACGEMRQLWVDVDARTARPGTYSLQLCVETQRLALTVRVHALELPPNPLAITNFTYPDFNAVPRTAPEFAVRDNVAHGINTWVLSRQSTPWPAAQDIDARGNLHGELDFAACDSSLALHSLAAYPNQVGWYWNFWIDSSDPSSGKFKHPYATAAWRRAVSQWLAAWHSHLATRGYGPQRVFMQPLDERGGPAVVALYRMLRELAPETRLALSLTRAQSDAEVQALEPFLDVAMFERQIVRERLASVARLRARGAEAWVYEPIAFAKSASPEEKYRMLVWLAWGLGLDGCAFWAYADAPPGDTDLWDDFNRESADWSVVYGPVGAPRALGEPLSPSKRWRAFRFGVQDVALFELAQTTLPELRQRVLHAVDDATIRAAVLRDALAAVLPRE